jgi:hypothetical protein
VADWADAETRQEIGPTPGGGAYSITDWDDKTGDTEIVEYDERGQVVCRRDCRILPVLPLCTRPSGRL